MTPEIPVQLRNVEPDLRYGYCRCGCGSETSIPQYNDSSKDWIAGTPLEYCNGHAHRKLKRYEVDPESGCWNWVVNIRANGYAAVCVDGKWHQAHRLLYEILNGPVPEGLDLDHICRNRRCINPTHLREATRAENTQCGAIAVLDPEKVLQIRRLYLDGVKISDITRTFGCSYNAIRGVVIGRTWRNIQ